MSLNKEDVVNIAHLARLAINAQDIPEYTRDLSNILGLVEQMNKVDTSNIAPMAHPLDMTQRMRPDEVKEGDQRDHFQKIAPETEDGLYLVPRVIE